jgi:putative intracellular protease/amidase
MKMANKKILIIMSDADSFPLKKGDETAPKESGFFLMELAKPLTALLNAGYEVTFASPKGKTPKPDPNSESLIAFVGNFYEREREQELIERMKRENGFASPRPFSTISDEELQSFDGVFIPGGHAPLADLSADPELGRILAHFHTAQKPTAAICHGPYAFLSTLKAPPGTFLYKGYRITSWSDHEEKMMETLWGGEAPKVESALRDAGAVMVTGTGEKFGGITVDREVVSGGNPMAAQPLGEQFLKMLSGEA